MTAFPGFDAADFDLFALPDFGARMGEIRARLRPKLLALGVDLADPIADLLGGPVFPHAAQHMRRRVNPPPETWAAFCRDRKGYKRWTHFRVAVSGGGARVTLFIEDDADDKPAFGAALEDAERILSELGSAPVRWYSLDREGEPAASPGPEELRRLGRDLQRLKTLKFQAGLPLDRAAAEAMGPDALEAWVLEQVGVLKPLYLAGVS